MYARRTIPLHGKQTFFIRLRVQRYGEYADKNSKLTKVGRFPLLTFPQNFCPQSKTFPQKCQLFLKNAEKFSSRRPQKEENITTFLQSARKRYKKSGWTPQGIHPPIIRKNPKLYTASTSFGRFSIICRKESAAPLSVIPQSCWSLRSFDTADHTSSLYLPL